MAFDFFILSLTIRFIQNFMQNIIFLSWLGLLIKLFKK